MNIAQNSRSHVSILSALLCLVGGCVTIPNETVSPQISAQELQQHVEFLSQPRLKGRSARSWESKTVRRYLCERLTQYGCVPWNGADSFEQPFGFGTNVIGVLPGSDPALANEYILISGHYDHLKAKLFSYYPGACDNASSVSVLLELLEKLSASSERPKRSICFAFFDSEENMCLGSFAFTCREDYDDSKIKAVLNLDLLGRDLLDVVDNCLIVAGTEQYGPIRQQISNACSSRGLNFIPFSHALIGPVGDHTAFTLTDRPVLFFTCGIYKDYHQTTDTPDKLNYTKMVREAGVIEQTLLALANASGQELAPAPAPITGQTIEAFAYILNRFKDNADFFQLNKKEIRTLNKVITNVRNIDPNTIDQTDLTGTQRHAIGKLLKLLKHQNPTLHQYSGMFLAISRMFAICPREFTAAYRHMVQHYLNHKPSLFSNNDFSYQVNLPMDAGEDLAIAQTGENEFIFGSVNTEISLNNHIHLIKGTQYSLTFNNRLVTCKGTLSDILDYTFSGKHPENLKSETREFYYTIGAGPNKSSTALSPPQRTRRQKQLWKDFFTMLQQDYPDILRSEKYQRYYHLDVCLGDPNCWSVRPPAIFISAPDPDTSKKDSQDHREKYIATSVENLYDRDRHIESRVLALNYLAYINNEIALTAIANVLDDATPYELKPHLISDPAFPLKNHPYIRKCLDDQQQQYEKLKDKTLAEIAHKKLKQLTKKDFGKDKEKWKRWIETQ